VLTQSEQDYVAVHAYLPEHLPQCLVPFAELEPFLAAPDLYYRGGDTLSFIGYPLDGEFDAGKLAAFLHRLIREHRPPDLRVTVPEIPPLRGYRINRREENHYSRLEVENLRIPPKVHNMVRRAERELEVAVGGPFTREYQRLPIRFIRQKALPKETAFFLHRIPDYLAASPTAVLVEARRRGSGDLIAYDVAELGAGAYCLYLFNITSRDDRYVPGASDLLFYTLVDLAREWGKRYINTGLGINPGVERFKSKWGAKPFLAYCFIAAVPRLFFWLCAGSLPPAAATGTWFTLRATL
jgi:hypothetical protein